MFYTEALRFDITVPIYPLLLMLALAVYCGYLSVKTRQLAVAFMSAFVVVWTFEIFIARDMWLFGWPIILFEQNLFKNAPFDMMLAPLLFLGARLMWQKNNRLMLWDAFLLVPLLAYGFNAVTVLSMTNSESIAFYQGNTPQSINAVSLWLMSVVKVFPWHTVILMLSCIASAFYLYTARLWQSRVFVAQLMCLLWLYLTGYALVQLLVGMGRFQISWLVEGPEHLTWLALIGAVVLLFLQRKQTLLVDATAQMPTKTKKYQSSSLDASMAKQLFQELEAVMKNKKLYLNDHLSLRALAEELGVTTHQLSQTINQMADRNFFDFVNSYRIEEAQHQLKDESNAHRSVHFIGESVGFNSKSAFYAAFKKHAGCTPAEFRRSLVSG